MRAHGVLLCFGSVSASMAVLDHLTQGRRSLSPWAVRPVLRRPRPGLTVGADLTRHPPGGDQQDVGGQVDPLLVVEPSPTRDAPVPAERPGHSRASPSGCGTGGSSPDRGCRGRPEQPRREGGHGVLVPAYVRRQLTQPPARACSPRLGWTGHPGRFVGICGWGITPGAPLATWAAWSGRCPSRRGGRRRRQRPGCPAGSATGCRSVSW